MTVNESYTEDFIFVSKPLTPFNAKNYPKEEGVQALLWLTFTTLYTIPASIVQTVATDQTSYIYMKFKHSSVIGAVDNCLGMGTFVTNVATPIHCKATYGLIP